MSTHQISVARRIERGGADWPLEMPDYHEQSPRAMWVRGQASPLQGPRRVALLGSRAATPYGEAVSAELAGELAHAGVHVVTGASFGIEAAAMRGVLAAQDGQHSGRPIVVLPGGVDRPHPVAHADLIEQIAAHGLVLSAQVPGARVTRTQVSQRMALMVSLAATVVIVEAGLRSGSRDAATLAHALGRPVLVVPGPITSIQSQGCHELLRGGVAQIATCAADVLATLLPF